jgi:hypothetical protein
LIDRADPSSQWCRFTGPTVRSDDYGDPIVELGGSSTIQINEVPPLADRTIDVRPPLRSTALAAQRADFA